jgi:hypothetical protein
VTAAALLAGAWARPVAAQVGAVRGRVALAAHAPARVLPAGPPARAVAMPAPGVVAVIAAGATVRGQLEPGDSLMTDSTYADLWSFMGAAGETVAIDARSNEFDTYVQLLDPSGAVIGEDDDSGGDLNSHLEATLPVAGTYHIVVNSAGHEQKVGTYTLTLE